jgi:hypothetical protein
MKKPSVRAQSDRIALAEVSAWLARVVGDEKATGAVRATALALGFGETNFSEEQADQILRALAESSDVLGLAAKRAMARRRADANPPSVPAASGARAKPAEADEEVHANRIIELLTPALGLEKARELVLSELKRARLEETMARRQAEGVFDALAMLPGIVGITARFAKARFLLR